MGSMINKTMESEVGNLTRAKDVLEGETENAPS
jgi:hypothetical protein